MSIDAQLRVPAVSASPADDAILEGHFQPRGKSSFLTAMFRTLSSGSRALMYYGPGSLPHRILEATAIELSQTSFDFRRLAVQAVRNAAYRAFQDDDLFPERFGATYASGAVVISAPISPFTHDVAIQEGDLLSTETGITARVLESVTLAAGQMSVIAMARSEVAGPVGYIAAGALSSYVSNTALRVTNPGPLDGGRDEESDDALHLRFQNYVRGIQTSSGRSLLSAANNAFAGGMSVKQAALIRPWRIPWMNREMAYGYVVIDAGGGSASAELVTDAQRRVSLITAAGEEAAVIPCNPYAVSLQADVECRRDANLDAVRYGLQAAYQQAFASTLIEDGSGQGVVKTLDIQSLLDAVSGVLTVNLSASEPGITVPVGARAVAGQLLINAYRGI